MLRNSDISVTVKKEKLLDALRHNREVHETDYNKAIVIYYQDLTKHLEGLLEFAKHSENPTDGFVVPFQEPQLKTDEYDKYITMLEMCEDTEFTLSTTEYDQIVNDNWSWITHAKMLNATYSARI